MSFATLSILSPEMGPSHSEAVPALLCWINLLLHELSQSWVPQQTNYLRISEPPPMMVQTSITHPLRCLPGRGIPPFTTSQPQGFCHPSHPSAFTSHTSLSDTEPSQGPLQPMERWKCPVQIQESCLPSKQQSRLVKGKQGGWGLTLTLLQG